MDKLAIPSLHAPRPLARSAWNAASLLPVAVGIVLVLLPAVTHSVDAPFYMTLASRMMIFGMIAMSLGLILGYGGMVCFGHAAYAGIGAYVVLALSQHAQTGMPLVIGPFALPGSTSAFVTWPLAAAVSALAALVTGAVALRTKGVYFIMITLSFAQMIYFFFINLQGYGGEDGMRLGHRSSMGGLVDLQDPTSFYYVVLFLLVLTYLLLRRVVDSRFGMVLRGCRQNERRMAALGFPTFRYKLTAFVISGAIAGLAGALVVNQAKFISPAFMHWVRSSDIIAMAVLGGAGNLLGPVLGAGAVLGLEEIMSSHTEHWQIVFGPMLLLIVLFARRGLYGVLTGKGADND